tara:strand:- start:4 stop:1458 length:1455 start_codon:yes stop_codon:yes gene_type:complete
VSNLSDLLPAGASGKTIEAVASGTLSSGQAVVLNSDGTVSTPLNQSESVSSPSVIQRGTHSAILYDASEDCFIAFYQDLLGSSPLTYRVGTLSGSTITWTAATATSILSNNADIAIAGDNNGGFLVICEDSNQSSRQYGIAGTVSGTTITLGTTVEFTTSTYGVKGLAYDANASKYFIVYINNQNSLYLTGIVATVTGTSVSFGTAVTIDSNSYIYAAKAAYDSANQKVVAIGSRSSQVNGYVATISGTSFSTGSVATVSSSRPLVDGDTQVCSATYDANAGSVVFVYPDSENSERGTAIVGQVSGTSLTWGSTQVIDASDKFSYLAISYDSTAKKVVVSGDYGDGSHTGRYSVGTITGTSSSWAALVQFESGEPKNFASAFSTADNKTAILYTDEGNSDNVTYVVQANAIQNYTDFIGITDAAISSSATGTVVVQGGTITGLSSLTTGSKYYVQDDGTVTTVSSSVNAGLAISTTSLLLNGDS